MRLKKRGIKDQRDLDDILNLIESVSEGFPTYFCSSCD